MVQQTAKLGLIVCLAALMLAGCERPPMPTPDMVKLPPSFALVNGGQFQLPDEQAAHGTVLVFISHECPNSNGYSPTIIDLYKQFQDRGIAFCLVYAEPDVTAADAAQHAKDFGYTCPAILDPDLTLARRYGITTTPEALLLSPTREMHYRGRIDNRYPELGKRSIEPTEHDLHDAIESLLAGTEIAHSTTKAIGCPIEAIGNCGPLCAPVHKSE